MNREEIKIRLQALVERYNQTTRLEAKENVSEETIRTWLNEFLCLFGWDVQNTHEVLQERCLRGVAGERLREIRSPHRKPDYILVMVQILRHFLMQRLRPLILSTTHRQHIRLGLMVGLHRFRALLCPILSHL